MFVGTPVRLIGGIVFTALLLYTTVSDVRSRRIPNAATALLAVTGFVFSMSMLPFGRGVLFGLGGLAVGFGIWLPFYVLRLLGAGDVKLIAAAGAWLGPAATVRASVLAMLAGGVLALTMLAWQRRLREGAEHTALLGLAWLRLRQLRAPVPVSQAARQLPYGVALAVGALLAAWYPRLT